MLFSADEALGLVMAVLEVVVDAPLDLVQRCLSRTLDRGAAARRRAQRLSHR